MSLSERIRFILSDGFAVRPSCAGGDNEETGEGIMLLQEVMNLSLQDLTEDKIKLLQDSFKKLHAKNEALQKKLDLIEEELQCAVCYNTVQEPETTPCGHVFCGECLYQVNLHALSNEEENANCPTCRNPILCPPPFPSFVLNNIAGRFATPPLLMAPDMSANHIPEKGNEDVIKTFLELYYETEINGSDEIKTNFLAPLDGVTVLDRIIRRILPDENERKINHQQDSKMLEMYELLRDTFNTYVKYHAKQRFPKSTLQKYISRGEKFHPSVGVHLASGNAIKLLQATSEKVLYRFFLTESGRNPKLIEGNISEIDWPLSLQKGQFVEMVNEPKFVGKITKLTSESEYVWYEVNFPMLLQKQNDDYFRWQIRLRP